MYLRLTSSILKFGISDMLCEHFNLPPNWIRNFCTNNFFHIWFIDTIYIELNIIKYFKKKMWIIHIFCSVNFNGIHFSVEDRNNMTYDVRVIWRHFGSTVYLADSYCNSAVVVIFYQELQAYLLVTCVKNYLSRFFWSNSSLSKTGIVWLITQKWRD